MAVSTFGRVVSGSSGPSDTVKRILQLSDLLGGIDNASIAITPGEPSDEDFPATDEGVLKFLTPYDTLEVLVPSARRPEPITPPTEPPSNREEPKSDLSETPGDSEKRRTDPSSTPPATPKPTNEQRKAGRSGPKSATRPRKSRKGKKSNPTTEPRLDLTDQAQISVEFPDKQP
jgi:hypothetical protein